MTPDDAVQGLVVAVFLALLISTAENCLDQSIASGSQAAPARTMVTLSIAHRAS